MVWENEAGANPVSTTRFQRMDRDVNNAWRLHALIQEKNLSQEYPRKYDELIVKIKASIQASYNLQCEIYHDNHTELEFWEFNIKK